MVVPVLQMRVVGQEYFLEQGVEVEQVSPWLTTLDLDGYIHTGAYFQVAHIYAPGTKHTQKTGLSWTRLNLRNNYQCSNRAN